LQANIIAGLMSVAVGSFVAQAGGSVAFEELLPSFNRAPKLKAEISSELVKQNLSAADVICDAVRLGRQWEQLGGARIGPYECQIGTQNLSVRTTPKFYDINGLQIGIEDPDVSRKAANVVESDFVWEWQTTKK
jgi:hypothetical protein